MKPSKDRRRQETSQVVHSIKVKIVGGPEMVFNINGGEAEFNRLHQRLREQENAGEFLVFDSGEHCVAINATYIAYAHLLFDIVMPGSVLGKSELAPPDNEEGNIIAFLVNNTQYKLSPLPDWEEADDDDSGPLAAMLARHGRGGISGLAHVLHSVHHNRYLIWQLTKREIVGRCRGSMLGLAWSLIHPIIMLGAYTFVFAVVFRARWGASPTESTGDFAIVLFAGLIIHGLFAECINRAPLLVTQNVNYVKKVVFPLEILPLVSAGSAVFHAAISLFVLFAAQIIMGHGLPWTALLFPFLVAPLLIATIGVSWILTSLGVYIRDVAHLTTVFTTVLLFLSPVFYPLSVLPPALQFWLIINPLTFFLEAGRGLLIFGQVPNLLVWLGYVFGSLLVAVLGYWWFQRARKGFTDVL